MIGYLRGKILHREDHELLLDCGGVGYEVSLHAGMAGMTAQVGDELAIFVVTLTREDGTSLYGFADLSEKELFLAVIKLPGVGPKTAQAIIASYTASDLAVIVDTADAKALTRIQGIGPKTAERLLLELRAPLKRLGTLAGSRMVATGGPGAATGPGLGDTEAALALEALGFRRSEFEPVLARLRKEGLKASTSELVKEALRRLRS